jgi:hypothetical protein
MAIITVSTLELIKKSFVRMKIRNVGLRSNNRGRSTIHAAASCWQRRSAMVLLSLAMLMVATVLLFRLTVRNLNSGTESNPHRHWSMQRIELFNRNSNYGPIKSILFDQKDRYEHRIAILLPYTTPNDLSVASILSYFTLFCYGAAGAADRIDFFVFHTGILSSSSSNISNSLFQQCPPNVIFIDLQSHAGLAKYLLRVVDRKYDVGSTVPHQAVMKYDELLDLVASYIKVNPYGLVEFKPALGHIFSEYIANYTHWGYSDFDIMFGDVNRWITADELNDFDIVTYTFGDQQRLYLRGQFTFHKNIPATVNQLWRECSYLSHMDVRFDKIVQHTQKYHVESAEGCYSSVVLDQTNISVKFAVKAWTDIYSDDSVYTHGIGVARSPATGRQVLYKLAKNSTDQHGAVETGLSPSIGDSFYRLRSSWFEKHDVVYNDRIKIDLQRPIGERIRLEGPYQTNDGVGTTSAKPCMYWALPKYQSKLCLQAGIVSSDDVVYWINGTLYKQKYENVPLSNSLVITTPLFHFQEWKRSYRYGQLASMYLSSTVQTFMLTPEGAIPLIAEPAKQSLKNSKANAVSPLGISNIKTWSAVLNDDRTQLPLPFYCIQSSLDGSKNHARCEVAVSWNDHVRTIILVPAPAWATLVNIDTDVTLVLTLQLSSPWQVDGNPRIWQDPIDHLETNINRWFGQPCIVIIALPESFKETTMAYIREKFDVTTNPSLLSCLITIVIHPTHDSGSTISRKALMNMAVDAVPTRWYISGLEVERGLSISVDTSFFAHRTVSSHSGVRGNIFLIPQFGFISDTVPSDKRDAPDGQNSDVLLNLDISIDNLLLAKRNKGIKHLSELESDCNDNEDHIDHLTSRIDDVWLTETLFTLGFSTSDKSLDEIAAKRIGMLEDLHRDVFEMVATGWDEDDESSALYTYEESPILLTDNLGPYNGIRTNEIVREIEAFSGQRCYNGVRLTQMVLLSYTLNILPVAFVSSTPKSRKLFDRSNATRCHATCSSFEEDDMWVLLKIASTEVKRAAKSAVLWAETTGLKTSVSPVDSYS